jgi:GT2 family glycosyltransferase
VTDHDQSAFAETVRPVRDDSFAPDRRLSVVIPSHNRKDLIARCLAALAAQDTPGVQVIVVDDLSDDGAREWALAFQRDNPGFDLTVVLNRENLGANRSRNLGVAQATAGLIALLDNDSIAEPGWARAMIAAFGDERTGAVVGLVKDPEPKNVYDLAFRGTHRVVTRGPAHRIVSCNMCVRAPVLRAYGFDERFSPGATTADGRPDTTVSGRSDEEGLFLKMRAAGYVAMSEPSAVVLHDHGYTRRSFFKQAWRGGRAAARLVETYRLRHRIDMVPLAAAYLTLVPSAVLAALVHPAFWVVPLACLGAAVTAYLYNDIARKGKTLGETARSFPVLLAYYHTRLGGYATQTARYRLRLERAEKVDLAAVPRVVGEG